MFVIQKHIKGFLLLWGAWGFFSSVCWADVSFEDWKHQFYEKAAAQGISAVQLSRFLQIKPYETAVKNDKNQAEFKKFLGDYLDSVVSTVRVVLGRGNFSNNEQLLNRISILTGVPPEIIVAIWGVETRYGVFTGKTPVMRALATLAYEGRRQDFFERELLALLKLIDNGDISSFDIKGSWAGGLGMPQFIPSSYLHHGVDYNNDGLVNLWHPEDALASIGNYLSNVGWQKDMGWGREVTLIDAFDYFLANDKVLRDLGTWQKLGVRNIAGQALSNSDIHARLFVPAGQFGPKFLLYENFDVIKRYNNSDAYALAVGLLSNRIIGKKGVVMPWPDNAKRATVNDMKMVQTALNAHGFDVGKIDGVFGSGTRRALQAYQLAKGSVADGFLTIALYRELVNKH